jgi:putative transcriptional regulator
MNSLEAHLLVASRYLLDGNFVRTVVLLVQHSDQGALGIVVNRPTCKTVKELWKEVGEAPCKSTRPVFLGGPVAGPIMAVHADHSLAEVEILPGVFFAAKKPHLDQLVLHPEGAQKIFVGHAGWGPGQLENELQQGAWLTLPATAEYIFEENSQLWEQLSKRIGEAVLQAALKIKHVPQDPSWN